MAKVKKLHAANGVDVCIVIFFSLFVLLSLVPMFNILSLSISDEYAVLASPGMIFPDFSHISLIAYKAVISSTAIYRSLLVSLLVVAVTTFIHMALTLMVGFAVSNAALPGRKAMMLFVLFTVLFSGGLMPTYLTLSSYGLIDTFWVLVLPNAVNGYNVILIKNHIANIPKGLLEAAEIDGANPFTVFIKIILPLCIPVVATLSMFCAIGKWNDWSSAYIYIYDATWLKPFQNVLQDLIVNPDTSNAEGMDLSHFGVAFQNALIVIGLVPIVVLYLFTQKYLTKGLFIGSVKG